MKLTGIITAMVTPLDAQYKVNPAGVEKLVDRLIAEDVSGLFILGTNGEFFAMPFEEKVAYAKLVVAAARGRVPVYAGSGGISTQEVIALTQAFATVGVSAVSIITPYLLKFSQAELLGHYERIADVSDLPIILYTIPANTQNNLTPESISQLAKHPKIIGLKDSSGDLEAMKKVLELTKKADFSVLVGSDSRILPALELGAAGAVAATSNVLTVTDVGIYKAFQAGDLAKAQKLQLSINDFRGILKLGTVPSALKCALNLIGEEVGEPYLPVLPITCEEDIAQIRQVLKGYEAIERFGELR